MANTTNLRFSLPGASVSFHHKKSRDCSCSNNTKPVFQEDYNITGIPRYFLIDKEGKIVSVYAPTPGKDFETLIDKTLKE